MDMGHRFMEPRATARDGILIELVQQPLDEALDEDGQENWVRWFGLHLDTRRWEETDFDQIAVRVRGLIQAAYRYGLSLTRPMPDGSEPVLARSDLTMPSTVLTLLVHTVSYDDELHSDDQNPEGGRTIYTVPQVYNGDERIDDLRLEPTARRFRLMMREGEVRPVRWLFCELTLDGTQMMGDDMYMFGHPDPRRPSVVRAVVPAEPVPFPARRPHEDDTILRAELPIQRPLVSDKDLVEAERVLREKLDAEREQAEAAMTAQWEALRTRYQQGDIGGAQDAPRPDHDEGPKEGPSEGRSE